MPSEDVTLVSTTDTPEQVAAALGALAPPDKPTDPPADPNAAEKHATPTPAATPAETPVATDKPTEPAKVEEPVEETPQQRAEKASKSARERRMARIQADIDDLIAQKHDARRDLEAEEQELAELQAKKTALQAEIDAAAVKPATPSGTTAPIGAFTTPKPKLEDTNPNGSQKYGSYEDWVDAVGAWYHDKAQVEADAKIAAATKKLKEDETTRETTRTVQTAQQQAVAAFQVKVDEFKTTHPDFDAVYKASADSVKEIIEELGKDALRNVDTYTIVDADHGAAMIYHLAQHPDELKRIVKLGTAQQLAALGKLDQRLADAPKPAAPARPAEPPVSRAPEPIQPVSSTPTASSVTDEEENWRAWADRRTRDERKRMGLPV